MSCIPISTSSTLCDICQALETFSPSGFDTDPAVEQKHMTSEQLAEILLAELKQKACTCDPAGWDEESEAEYEAWCIRFADQQNIHS